MSLEKNVRIATRVSFAASLALLAPLAVIAPTAHAQNQLWITQFATSSADVAYALAPDGAGGAIVAGRTRGSLSGPSAGSKIDEDSGLYALDWMRLFGMAISDIPSAIIAPTPMSGGVAVFVAGRSFLLTTHHDQVSLRYTEPP